MLKKIILLISFVLSLAAVSQKYDLIIDKKIYKSYYNKSLYIPTVVSYELYKAGGNCDRNHFEFYNDINLLVTATDAEYSHSGYDKGHMSPAEDFAYNCTLDELTFRYYNCVPQWPDLNRNVWLSYERLERAYSQTDSVFVLNINIVNNNRLKGVVGIPDYCIKSIWSLTSHKCLLSVICNNAIKSSSSLISTSSLDSKYNLTIEKFLPFKAIF